MVQSSPISAVADHHAMPWSMKTRRPIFTAGWISCR
jgi:hypothetical protein